MLHQFLIQSRKEILALTKQKTLDLAGLRPSSAQLKEGLPIFYDQLLTVLEQELERPASYVEDKVAMEAAARDSDEPAMAAASGRPQEVAVANSAVLHGTELCRLGYTLSHVVHAYGAMCQSITEIAQRDDIAITPVEFHDLNRCLDVAIASAVTGFQSQRTTADSSREAEHLGFLAHELRNGLNTVKIALHLIESGTVGFGGSTGVVLKKGLKRIDELIERSLTEVRLRVDPKVHLETINLLQVIEQIVETADIEAQSRKQVLLIQVDPTLVVEADQQLIYAALSNLIQNALKFTHTGGRIQVRGKLIEDHIVIEVEDECGGLSSNTPADLFKPFEQQHKNRKGIGLGLTIVQRAVALTHGKTEVVNFPGKGCLFRITLPKTSGQKDGKVVPDAQVNRN